ncbi:MAG: polyprenyl diphosphate synthase, partial [Bacilli bacterium]|nr:polyprenyl diphosphate synthase [Bacilli bacterium]
WNRPQDEIDNLFNYLDEFFQKYLDEFMEKGVRVSHMGDISRLPEHSQITLKEAIEKTKDNKNFVFNICLNYGSRQEILKAVKEIAQEAKDGKIAIEDINEETVANHLYSAGLPEVDLMIRTSGEQRLSNYILYQVAYAEFIFTPVHWPDFKKPDLIDCLKEFCNRNRRFGSLTNQ